MKRIAIVGAGQSGLQLALGLLGAGYEVSLYSDRSAQEIHDGHVMSSQCMFDSALEIAPGWKASPSPFPTAWVARAWTGRPAWTIMRNRWTSG
jgi:cation diffusion facilitator CzcD-associated flavoprotein CzcO